eukprot:gb/GFBE01000833.1/.p1 GENE.gb/GFBE01000833.1/~~gb/GFBE01000833.1/.p1  ORF type:complete len:360 (+),score=61.71 gb/GFBE01000833.1/:1-1080(+)
MAPFEKFMQPAAQSAARGRGSECRFYLAGQCNFGDSCKFTHGDQLTSVNKVNMKTSNANKIGGQAAEHPAEPQQTRQQSNIVRQVKYCTSFCRFFKVGECRRGEACKFAHYSEQLQPQVSLFKTQLCYDYEAYGTCRRREKCKYAHGPDELCEPEVMPLTKPAISGPPEITSLPEQHNVMSSREHKYRTSYCVFNELGRCRRGDSCCFAHSKDELRSSVSLLRTRLCFDFAANGECHKGDNCMYAHGVSELRQPQPLDEQVSMGSWSTRGPEDVPSEESFDPTDSRGLSDMYLNQPVRHVPQRAYSSAGSGVDVPGNYKFLTDIPATKMDTAQAPLTSEMPIPSSLLKAEHKMLPSYWI